MSKNLTQDNFSARVGISRTHLQAIESGRSIPTVEIAYKIMEVFQCTWADLLGSPASVITAAAMPPLPKKKR